MQCVCFCVHGGGGCVLAYTVCVRGCVCVCVSESGCFESLVYKCVCTVCVFASVC